MEEKQVNAWVCIDGKVSEVSPKNGVDFKLKELQSIVGGYIEIVDLNNGWVMVIDEEGKLKNKPFNLVATMVASTQGAISNDDFIVGDCLVCKSEMVE